MNENKAKFNLGWISTYRNELFGISILSIVLFHFCSDFQSALSKHIIGMTPFYLKSILLLDYLDWISSTGVEIFVFLSGMGLFFSFSNNHHISSFYARRFRRILPAYIIVASIFWALKDFYFRGEEIEQYLSDLTFRSFWTDGVHSIWFILLMIICYLIFPFIYKVIDANKNSYFLILLVASYIGPILLYFTNIELYHNTELVITRIPTFLVGSFLAKYIKQKKELPATHAVLFVCFALFVRYCKLNLDFEPYLSRYLISIFAFGLIVIYISAIHIFREYHIVRQLLCFFGKYSLEIYMLHVTLRNLMKEFGFEAYRISQYFLMFLLAVILSILLHKLCIKINQAIDSIALAIRGGDTT